ncbi:MAG: ABC transporter permease subunit [Chloroflexi bacterium]|nr:ABC transporter permease subunit [Chloroflexota bacterium]
MATPIAVHTDAPIPIRRSSIQADRAPAHFLGLGFPGWSLVAALMIGAAGWAFIVVDSDTGLFLSSAARTRLADFFAKLAGRGAGGSAGFWDATKWWTIARLTVDSLSLSLIAVALAGIGAVVTMTAAASNITYGDLAFGNRTLGRAIYLGTRAIHILTRSVPEVVWALVIVFVMAPGMYAAALALAAHNYGVLGRLGAELVENVDPRPLRALRSSGAGNIKLLLYGILPQVLPQILTFVFYRWEVIIRASAVVGFVAAVGLGYQLRLDLSFFRYTDVAMLLVAYILSVWLVDLVSVGLRKLAR